MKRVFAGITVTAVALALFVAPAFAEKEIDKPKLDTSGIKCEHKTTAPVINVTQKVVKDADSGTAGNFWAFDFYNRQIKVWPQGESNYCAEVRYDGSFEAIEGQKSPGNTGFETGKEKGTLHGGYRAAITGSLLASPTWPTHGSVGTFNYNCDSSGNCPGRVSWTKQYFQPGYTFSQPWWGWIYHGGKYGTWVNAISGNSGDIL